MADVLGKKISELAETTDLAGLYTIGSDRNNQSKKVPLQFVKEAADYANAQGDYAKGVGDTIQGNTGVNEYPAFSSSTQYAAGSVVRYNNKLYRFTVLHPAGAWVGTDAIETSIKAETDVKLIELESEMHSAAYLQVSHDFSSGSFAYPFSFRKGLTYKLTNKGEVTSVFATRLTPTSENIDVIQPFYAGQTKTFIPTEDAYFLYCSYPITIEIVAEYNSVNQLKNRIDDNDLGLLTLDGKISSKANAVNVFSFESDGQPYVPFYFEQGKKYRLTNMGDSNIAVSTRLTPTSENIDVIQPLRPKTPLEYTPTQTAYFFNCTYATSVIIESLEDVPNELYSIVSSRENYDDYFTNGEILYNAPIDVNNIGDNPSFKHLVIAVKRGDRVIANGLGGENARFLTITDSEYIPIYVSSVNFRGEENRIITEDGFAIINVNIVSSYSVEVVRCSKNIGGMLHEKLDSSEYINEKIVVFDSAQGKVIPYKIVKGGKYKVTNIEGIGAMLFYTKETNTSSYIDGTSKGFYKNQSYTFQASASTELIYAYMNKAGAFKIERLDVISKTIHGIESKSTHPLVSFDNTEELLDMSHVMGEFDFSRGIYQTDTIEQVISKFDALMEANLDYITKLDSKDIAAEIYADIEYPWYTRGIEEQQVRTIDYGNGVTHEVTFYPTPLYDIPVYLLKSNDNIGKSYYSNIAEYPKKKVFIYAGGHGNENFAPYNLYQLAYNLCHATTGNYAKLRATCDFYILPYLNGYGCYHTMRCNANRVDVERGFPTSSFTSIDFDTIDDNFGCSYSGEIGGNEFETKVIMGCIKALNPDLSISCHNYGKEGKSQFYAETSYDMIFKDLTNALLNLIPPICKKYENYFGKYNTFNQNITLRTDGFSISYVWMKENGYYGLISEVGSSINFLDGESITDASDKPSFTDDVASVAEITIRCVLCSILKSVVA